MLNLAVAVFLLVVGICLLIAEAGHHVIPQLITLGEVDLFAALTLLKQLVEQLVESRRKSRTHARCSIETTLSPQHPE